MDKVRKIRTINTLLAAGGGVLLSAIVVFAYLQGFVPIPSVLLILGLSVVWGVNILFVFLVASGVSERSKDPSLSLPQMYWASSNCLVCIVLVPEYLALIFSLLYVISVFGVFSLKTKAFSLYTMVIVVSLALTLFLSWSIGSSEASVIELVFTWLVYSLCFMMLVQLCHSVVTLRRKLKTKNEELRIALDAKSRFLANMSHEIRTPMNGVIGMLELIEKEDLNEKLKRYTTIAKSSGLSLVSLINEILDYSKLEVHKIELEKKSFNLKRSLHQLCSAFYHLAAEKDVHLIIDLDDAIPNEVVADELRIKQIFNNVVGNAIKFTSAGQISVRVRVDRLQKDSVSLRCCVIDTGTGIPAESLASIFESFSQADASTTREFGGSGLGLAIARELVHLMGGELGVESEWGQGSRFSFTLVLDCSLPANTYPPILDGASCMIIGDNNLVCEALRWKLESLGGRAKVETSSAVNLDLLIGFAEGRDEALCFLMVSAIVETEKILHILNLPGVNLKSFVTVGQIGGEICQKVANQVDEPYAIEDIIKTVAEIDDENKTLVLNDSEDTHLSHQVDAKPDNNTLAMGSIRILLVEDNRINQEVATMLLEDCGARVETAIDGLEALQKLQNVQNTYDLVFMDCQMPNMDGYKATGLIRQGEAGDNYKDVPIIAMTANALSGDRERCLEAGMTDYVSKPVTFEALQDMLDTYPVAREPD